MRFGPPYIQVYRRYTWIQILQKYTMQLLTITKVQFRSSRQLFFNVFICSAVLIGYKEHQSGSRDRRPFTHFPFTSPASSQCRSVPKFSCCRVTHGFLYSPRPQRLLVVGSQKCCYQTCDDNRRRTDGCRNRAGEPMTAVV